MNERLMVLPAKHFEHVRVLSMPEDMEEHEAFRHVTGVIASVQESNADCSWEDVAEALEEHGFEAVEFVLGPEFECR
jgi:hypothetical protein